MSAAIHEIPMAALFPEEAYNRAILGRRVQHKHLQVMGRLNGWVRHDREMTWLQVDTNEGTFWWSAKNLTMLGPIPMPGSGGAA